MDFLSKEQLSFIVQIGYAACFKGHVKEALNIFSNLLIADEDCIPAKTGNAMIYMLGGEYDKSKELLLDLISKYPDKINNEAYGLLCLGAALYKKEDDLETYAALVSPEDKTATRLVDSAREVLANNQ